MSCKNLWTWEDEFVGHRVYSSTAGSNVGHNWLITDTSSAGTPTYTPVTPAESGGVALAFDSQTEAQNVCLYQGDNLCFDIDKIVEAHFRVKMNQATKDSATTLAFGLIGARNDAIDSIAQNIHFRLAALTASNVLVVESDDGTTDLDDKATGQSLSNSFLLFTISFALGTSDIRFFIDGQPVATGTTFNMSAYTGGLQPYMQLQKTSDNNTDGATMDWVQVRGRR